MLFAALLPLWVCYIVTGYFFPQTQTPRLKLGYRVLFTVAMFFGITSCTFYIGKLVFGELYLHFSMFEVVVFGLILIVFSVLRKRTCPSMPDDAPHPKAPPKWQRHLRLAYVALLLLAAIQSLLAYWVEQHGWWDAWAIWNLRARFLYMGNENWLRVFSIGYAHPDYPLLIPAAVARLWHYLGNPIAIVPAITALAFCVATIGLLTELLTTLRGKTIGLLAGIVLVGTYKFIEVSTYQIADVPLAFYFMATITAICLFVRYGLPRHLFLAGMMAGFAAWTKNEGLLFVIICASSFAITSFKQKPAGKVAKELAVFISGFLPFALMVLLFKLTHAPANDLFSGLEIKAILTHIMDASRYSLVFIEWLENFNKIAKVWLFILPWAMIVLLRKYRSGGDPFYFQIGIATTLLMMIGYTSVYLITPHNLQWHLDTSMWRLIIHLWPIILFSYFLRLPSLAFEET